MAPRRSSCLLLVAVLIQPAEAVHGAVFTVGPSGTHATIQGAVTAAGTAGDHEIRIAAGTYHEAVQVQTANPDTITISGSWNTTFTAGGAGDTIIDAPAGGPSLRVYANGSTRIVRDLVVRGGLDRSAFEGSVASGTLTILRSRLEGADGPGGGALRVSASAGGLLILADSVVADNVTRERSPVTFLDVTGGDVEVRGSHFTSNRQLVENDQADGAAFLGVLRDGGSLLVEDTLFERNQIDSETAIRVASAGKVEVDDQGAESSVVLRRNRFLDNVDVQGHAGAQLSLGVRGGPLTMTDSLFAGDAGLEVASSTPVHLANLTIDVGGPSVRWQSDGDASIANSLLTTDMSVFFGTVTELANRVGSDLGFVNPEARDYRLLPGSPGIDAGTGSPPAGLGDSDLAGNSRVVGAAVDLGAFEVGPSPCSTDDDTLCLGSRFAVDVAWQRSNGQRGAGQAVALTPDTGYFWFFNPANAELVTKRVNGCPVNGNYWIFAGGLTNVTTAIAVTDTANGTIRRYDNPQGTPFQPLQDTAAFATCP